MRKYLLLLLALLVFSSPAFAATAYDGTGDSDSVVPNAPATSAFTYCWLHYVTAFNADQAILGYGQGNATGSQSGTMFWTQSSGSIRFQMFGGSGGTGTTSIGTASTWHHVCFAHGGTFDNQFYFDGTMAWDAGGVDAPNAQSSSDVFIVGATVPNENVFFVSNFVGSLSHVAYWNTRLTSAEITSLANKSTCPTAVQPTHLKVWLPMGTHPPTEQAQSLAVTENGNPTLVADPSGLPCAAPATNNLFLHAEGQL